MLLQNALNVWWLIVPVSLATAILEIFVPFSAEQAAQQSKTGTFVGFLIFGLVGGVIAVQVYFWIAGRWPEDATSIYRWLAFGLAAALTIAAFVMFTVVKNWTAPILWTVMNVLWGVGYGWFIPRFFG